MLYVVKLYHTDGSITYAGKESWSNTPEPQEVLVGLKSAQGKARYWRKIGRSPGHRIQLTHIEILPCTIAVDSTEVVETFEI